MLGRIGAVVIATAVGIFAWGPGIAQTPDAVPPAQEGICDSLIGGTPGLYGLCVAYCEAQDLDEMFQEIKAGGHPGEKILANYNRKKQPGDPDMPCIVSAPEACPCFNTPACNAADFVCQLNLLTVGDLFAGRTCSLTQLCNNSATPDRTAQDSCNDFTGLSLESRQVQVAVTENGAPGVCLARSSSTTNGTSDNSSTGMIIDFATSERCLNEINAYDGNGPLDGNLNGNAGGACFLANP